MNGRVILGEQVVHNFGMTINRNIEGTDICYSEVLKRVTPKLNGYYMFESEVYIIGVLYSWFIELSTNIRKARRKSLLEQLYANQSVHGSFYAKSYHPLL